MAIIEWETQIRIGFKVGTASYRQLQVGFDCEFVRTGFEYKNNYDSESEGEDDIHDSQAVHSSRIGCNYYGRKGLRIVMETAQLFRTVSNKWQRWPGLL